MRIDQLRPADTEAVYRLCSESEPSEPDRDTTRICVRAKQICVRKSHYLFGMQFRLQVRTTLRAADIRSFKSVQLTTCLVCHLQGSVRP